MESKETSVETPVFLFAVDFGFIGEIFYANNVVGGFLNCIGLIYGASSKIYN